ncbi:SDR family NAD(P)-dependent oxidoreductase [Pendulispora albinea]|uniref:SDR family NAD(P)-dependent oxidoreductase n=1 Tax=Pendulispora albinea TaxID=2741071 RepID=A0ABZ2LXV9_9BACT
MGKPVCVVVGIGPGNGAAFARRFAKEGYAVALLSRTTDLSGEIASTLPGARAYACDASDPAAIEAAFDQVARELGEVSALVYNAGSGVWGTAEEISAKDFEASWRVNALGLFVASQKVIPAMKRAGRGNIVVIGATASRRGGARAAAFAPAKAAQKSLTESLARHLGPAGIHVSLVVVDGTIDTPRARTRMPEHPDDFFLRPDDIADAVYHLTAQPKSAWTFELEVRPFGEKW